jgi:hypothetical protein
MDSTNIEEKNQELVNWLNKEGYGVEVEKHSPPNGYALTVIHETMIPSQIHDIIQDQYGYKFRNCFINKDKLLCANYSKM